MVTLPLLTPASPITFFANYNSLESRLQTLEESKKKVLTQLAELQAHREKLQTTSKGVDTTIPGRLW